MLKSRETSLWYLYITYILLVLPGLVIITMISQRDIFCNVNLSLDRAAHMAFCVNNFIILLQQTPYLWSKPNVLKMLQVRRPYNNSQSNTIHIPWFNQMTWKAWCPELSYFALFQCYGFCCKWSILFAKYLKLFENIK